MDQNLALDQEGGLRTEARKLNIKIKEVWEEERGI